ncbi:MAG: glucose 1-dehydrogenase [Anaerolineales bacterium]|jgi:NAD(P)-dependent dehydrogenase (short-subunit alcohol dehydrogenase family)
MRLVNKTAIVTGGAMGIGRAIVEAFAHEGAQVVLADLNEIAGAEVVAAVEASGGRAIFRRADVSRWAEAEALIAFAVQTFGRVDILVNDAGVYCRGDVVTTDEATWDWIMGINLKSVYLCSRAAIPLMRQQGRGVILNISSSVGWISAAPGIAAYAASKFGVTGLTKAMACDHLREGIRVNAVCPGPTDTPLLNNSRPPDELATFRDRLVSGRLGQPEEIAAAAVFLCSDEASFITGAVIPVDGGQTAHL